MRNQLWFFKFYFVSLLLLWSMAMGAAIYLHLREEDDQLLINARIEARALFQRDLLYLEWNSRQGGVYAPVSPEVQPNPHLTFLPDRDLRSPSGVELTLVNPAVLARRIFTISATRFGSGGHLVSTRPLDETDRPDAWEEVALEALRNGAGEVVARVEDGGEEYLRVLQPFSFGEDCLRCHPRVNSGQAGVSLKVPLGPLSAALAPHTRGVTNQYLILWFFGNGALVAGFMTQRRQMAAAAYSDECRNQAEQSLNYLTYYDMLTGLPNRELFNDRTHLALAQAERLDQQLAVVQLGLENLRQVNGSFGHAAGDRIQQEIARRLTLSLRPDDSVARFDNDRYLLLLPGLRKVEDAVTVMEKIRRNLDPPVIIDDKEIYVTASFGVALYPTDGRDGDTLLRNSESALQRDKEQDRNSFTFYAPAMNARAVKQIALDSGLRRALELGQLEVHYQPQVDGCSGEIVGAEALLRWRHPEFGMVSPAEFIPIAEESGMIVPIGRWVLETACRQAAHWATLSGRRLDIGVNLSPRQFQQPDMVEMIEEILAASGLPPENLEIEITEGTLIRDFDRAIENLTDLKVRGVRIAIDDFGTGYSSFSYLVKFPIDRLKIDRSFVSGLETDEGNRQVVSSIVDMSHRLHIGLIAEGVETGGQRDILLQNDCSQMQGHLFGGAADAAGFARLIGIRPGWSHESVGFVAMSGVIF